MGRVAQLVRAPRSHRGGPWFESRHDHGCGDFLIVGVESDRCVVEYKDYGRPIIGEDERASIVAELDCVNAAFTKDIELDAVSHVINYNLLSSNKLFCGRNFHYKDRIAEDAQKAGAGLEVLDTKQPTTTKIIENILERYANQREEGRII